MHRAEIGVRRVKVAEGGRRREKGLSRLLKSGIKGVAGRLDSSRLA